MEALIKADTSRGISSGVLTTYGFLQSIYHSSIFDCSAGETAWVLNAGINGKHVRSLGKVESRQHIIKNRISGVKGNSSVSLTSAGNKSVFHIHKQIEHFNKTSILRSRIGAVKIPIQRRLNQGKQTPENSSILPLYKTVLRILSSTSAYSISETIQVQSKMTMMHHRTFQSRQSILPALGGQGAGTPNTPPVYRKTQQYSSEKTTEKKADIALTNKTVSSSFETHIRGSEKKSPKAEEIADKVYHLIEKRLRLEKERKGFF